MNKTEKKLRVAVNNIAAFTARFQKDLAFRDPIRGFNYVIFFMIGLLERVERVETQLNKEYAEYLGNIGERLSYFEKLETRINKLENRCL